MAEKYVRIYAGSDPDSNVIGASMSTWAAILSPEIRGFFEREGYDTEPLPSRNNPNIPWSKADSRIPEESDLYWHMEVRPPLADDTVALFGRILQQHSGIIEAHYNTIILQDNRQGDQAAIA